MEASLGRNTDKGLIFNIQRFSLHDGPGIRTTVFSKGCPLKCQWCSNPESINPYPEIMTYDMKCIGCGKCLEVCPNEAITMVNNISRIERAKCNLCMECAKACPSGAIEEVGKYLSQEEVMREIEKDRLFYLNSGGGVTFSGGEPLQQWQFVREIFKQCKEENIPTALDTTGYARWEVMEKVLEYTDLVLYDIKHLDPLIHVEGTGATNKLILKNVAKTVNRVETWLRIPVIPGYNDSTPYFRKLAQFSANLGVDKVSLLPYHTMGERKYEHLGRLYPFEGVNPPSEESVNSFKEVIESCGLRVKIGN